MHRTKLIAVFLGLFTVVMTGIGAELEYRAIKSVRHASTNQVHPRVGAVALSYPADDSKTLEQKIDIIRDQFKMFLIFGGAFGGAMVCVLIRLAFSIRGVQAAVAAGKNSDTLVIPRALFAAYFTVSLLSSVFCTPLILKHQHWIACDPEECFGGSFLLAACVWVFWELAAILGDRMKTSMSRWGIWGTVRELRGEQQQDSNTGKKD